MYYTNADGYVMYFIFGDLNFFFSVLQTCSTIVCMCDVYVYVAIVGGKQKTTLQPQSSSDVLHAFVGWESEWVVCICTKTKVQSFFLQSQNKKKNIEEKKRNIGQTTTPTVRRNGWSLTWFIFKLDDMNHFFVVFLRRRYCNDNVSWRTATEMSKGFMHGDDFPFILCREKWVSSYQLHPTVYTLHWRGVFVKSQYEWNITDKHKKKMNDASADRIEEMVEHTEHKYCKLHVICCLLWQNEVRFM